MTRNGPLCARQWNGLSIAGSAVDRLSGHDRLERVLNSGLLDFEFAMRELKPADRDRPRIESDPKTVTAQSPSNGVSCGILSLDAAR
jgi:hypothetical protein